MATRVYNEPNGVYYTNNEPVVAYSRFNAVFRVLYVLLDILEALLAIRFVLRMLGASTVSGFTNFIYSITQPFVAPFNGIVPATVARGSGLIIEWSTLIAMIVYALIVYAVVQILRALFPNA